MKEFWFFTKKYKKDILKPVDVLSSDQTNYYMEKSRTREVLVKKMFLG